MEKIKMTHPDLDSGQRVIYVHPESVPHWKRAGWEIYEGPDPLTEAEKLASEAEELARTRSQRKAK
jgi:hypothetical protein